MAQDFEITALDVIGYADQLTESVTPAVVPPVFRVRTKPELIIVPPFHFQDGKVVGATVVGTDELHELEAEESVTLFKREYPGRDGYELWLDQKLVEHYDRFEDVKKHFNKIAAAEKGRLIKALRSNKLDAAEQHSRTLLCVDGRNFEHVLLYAAVARTQKNEPRVARMRDIAEKRGQGTHFDWKLKELLTELLPQPCKFANLGRRKPVSEQLEPVAA